MHRMEHVSCVSCLFLLLLPYSTGDGDGHRDGCLVVCLWGAFVKRFGASVDDGIEFRLIFSGRIMEFFCVCVCSSALIGICVLACLLAVLLMLGSWCCVLLEFVDRSLAEESGIM